MRLIVDDQVFNIGGNKYRLIAFIRYPVKRVFIRHILTPDADNREKWKEDLLNG
jgi:mRNA interferase HigB